MLIPAVSFDMIIDNYFTSFRLLTHLTFELTIFGIRVTGVLNKNRLRKCTSIGDKQLQKKERDHFEQRNAHLAKKHFNLCGWLERQQGGLHSVF